MQHTCHYSLLRSIYRHGTEHECKHMVPHAAKHFFRLLPLRILLAV